MQTITITRPDDWHVHLRDHDFLITTVAATARCFQRAVIMPNLSPAITTTKAALQYAERIKSADTSASFTPLMTLYLTDQTTEEEIRLAKQKGIVAAKLYPAGATTNSENAVQAIDALYPVLEVMSEVGMLLLVHGEVTDDAVDIFDREARFIDEYLAPIHQKFTQLSIVFEHITTSNAVDFVLSSPDKVGATITPQHLLLNRNDLLVGGIRPHYYCLPIVKRQSHQNRLLDVVSSGDSRFFLGTDSAPHLLQQKQSACGCAGCYSAPAAIELYTHIFDSIDALTHLENFASFNGPNFYGLPRNTTTLTLAKKPWQIPDEITLKNGEKIIPLKAGNTINWQIVSQNNRRLNHA